MKESHDAVLQYLIEEGYLKFVPESQRNATKQQLLTSMGYGIIASDSDDQGVANDRRDYPADSEELAEGKIGYYLMLMKDTLAQEGVRLESIIDDFRDDHYDVILNGERFKVYDMPIENCWAASSKRFLEIVNELLRRANSKERLFCIYGGNEGRVILLTNEMHEYLRRVPWIDRKWMPYRAESIPQ